MRAIRITEFGGPEVLELVEDAPVPEPGEGEVLVRVTRAGINFADTHQRENSYLARYELPLIPGAEVAGVERDGTARGGGGAASAPAATPSTRSRPRARRSRCRTASRDARRARDPHPGPDGLAPLQDLRAAGRGRERRGARRGRRRRLAGRAARQPIGAGRVIATASTEEKRALRARAGRGRGGRRREPEDLAGALLEANGGARVDVVFEMAGGARVRRSR